LSLARFHALFHHAATSCTATYSLSLHDALPIFNGSSDLRPNFAMVKLIAAKTASGASLIIMAIMRIRALETCSSARMTRWLASRSEEHTSELQSLRHLVCRLLLEKKKQEQHKTT